MKSKRDQIWDSLSDPEYRKQFIDEHVNVGIAFQIRSLRNRQNLTQADLARALNVKQPLLSSWENPNYGNYSLNTLKDLAKAFDVGLLVRFVPFSKLVDWTVDLTPDVIAPANFNEEQSLNARISLEKLIDDMDANRADQFAAVSTSFAAVSTSIGLTHGTPAFIGSASTPTIKLPENVKTLEEKSVRA